MTGDRSILSTLGPMLPLSVAAILMRGVGRAAERAGCTQVAIGGGLQISGVLPESGARPQEHLIDVGRSGFHQGMLAWACTCCESSDRSFSDVGRAVADAVGHVPDGEHWSVDPVDRLIGGSTAELPAAGADDPSGEQARLTGLNVGEGFTELQVSVARDTVVRLVDAAKTFLTSTGAPNYVEHQVHDPETGERYTLTIQRPGRKTPHDLRREAESDLNRRLAQVNRVVTALNRWQRRREDTPDGSGFSEFYDQVLAAVDVVGPADGEPAAEDTSPSPSNGAT